MRKKVSAEILIPEGFKCEITNKTLKCNKGDSEITKDFSESGINLKILEDKIIAFYERANRREEAKLNSVKAHIKNMFKGLENKFVYELEICNVHFPMTVKVEKEKLVINNFLGEKEKRFATILEDVNVEVKGQKIIVSGEDVEKAGQTAANIEKATKVGRKDRRIFQDGIFMTSKKGRPI